MARVQFFVGTDRFFGAGREVDLKFSEAKRPKDEKREVQHPADFGFDLIRTAKQMRIVLRESTHPKQSVEHSGSAHTGTTVPNSPYRIGKSR